MRSCLLALLILLAWAAPAQAGWRDLGDALNTDVMGRVENGQDLASVAGTPWITWMERAPGAYDYQILAARWTGSAWTTAGGPLNVDPDQGASSPSIADVGGTPYVTWDENQPDGGTGTRHVQVARWTGTAWEAVGGQVDTDQGSGPQITSVAGVPYVTYGEYGDAFGNTSVQVRRYDGTHWVPVGSAVTTLDGVIGVRVQVITAVGGAPVVAWREASGEIDAARFDGTAWIDLGSQINHPGSNTRAPTLAVLDGAPAIAFMEYDSMNVLHIRVRKWSGTSWDDVGGDVGTTAIGYAGLNVSLTELSGVPAIAWPETGVGVHVSAFDGDTWSAVGRTLRREPGGQPGTPVLADVAGVAHVSWLDRYIVTTGETEVEDYHLYAARIDPDHVKLSAATTSVAESAGSVTLSVTRTGDLEGPVSVHYGTQNGTAVAGQDYVAASGTVTFADGQASRTVTVALLDDAVAEDDETFTLALSKPSPAAVLEAPTATAVTITDADVDTSIIAGPSGPTSDATPTFFFTSSPAAGTTFECAFDAGAFSPCASDYSPSALPGGEHTFRVRAIRGGTADPTPATQTFFVDTKSPVTTVVVAPVPGEGSQVGSGSTYTGKVKVDVTAADPAPSSGVQAPRCVLDPVTPPVSVADIPPGCSITTAASGDHVVYAGTLDAAGNADTPPIRVAFTIADAFDTAIRTGPEGATNNPSPAFTFVATPAVGATFECWVDGDTPAPCPSPFTAAALLDGQHTFHVRALTAEGVPDPTPAERAFFVDTVAPVTTLGVEPQPGLGTQPGPGNRFTGRVSLQRSVTDPAPGSGGGSIACALDPPSVPATPADISGSCPLVVDAVGQHAVYAAATDAAGNQEAVVRSVKFEILGPPDTTITDGPQGTVYERRPTFAFTSTQPGSTFRCRIDNVDLGVCTSPYRLPNVLATQAHFFEVQAISAQGAADPTRARRDFGVGDEVRHYHCEIDDFRALNTPDTAQDPHECLFATERSVNEDAPGCPTYTTIKCVSIPKCPSGARCALRTELSWSDADPSQVWGFYAVAWLNRSGGASVQTTPCGTDKTPHVCTPVATASGLGADGNMRLQCQADRNGIGGLGPDAARRLTCDATVTITPADALETTTRGTAVTAYAPGPGTAGIAPGGAAGRSAMIASRGRGAFEAVTKRVRAAGPVTFQLRLRGAARRRFKRKHDVRVTARLSFRPAAGGATQHRTVRLTLRRPEPLTKD